ncbi:MAG: hypothetical protein AAF429_12650 [Pseudomonadota bacterium]
MALMLAAPAMADCVKFELLAQWDKTALLSDKMLAEDMGAEKCGLSNAGGGLFAHVCQWSFPLRDPAALSFFEEFEANALACLPLGEPLAPDQQVNHPDTYALKQYPFKDGVLNLSLKDKGALGRSFVFLRVSGGE